MTINSNIYFNIIASLIFIFFITYLITEKVIIPRIPKYKYDEDMLIEEITIAKKEKRGLVLAGLSFILIMGIFIYMIIPGLPYSGILLDNTESTYLGKLFGSSSYFSQGLIYTISFLLIVMGGLYGWGARTIKTINQVSDTLYSSLNNIGNILLLIFLLLN